MHEKNCLKMFPKGEVFSMMINKESQPFRFFTISKCLVRIYIFYTLYVLQLTSVENEFVFRLVDNSADEASKHTRQPVSVDVFDYYDPGIFPFGL